MKKQSLVMPIIVLTLICLVVTFGLSYTNNITSPIIKEQERIKSEAAKAVVLPEGEGFEVMELSNLPEGVNEVSKTSNDAGFVVSVTGSGYGGTIVMMVGFDAEGTITGTSCITNAESKGFGADLLVEGSDYQKGLVGIELNGEIATVAGTTVTSSATKAMLQNAFAAYELAIGEVA